MIYLLGCGVLSFGYISVVLFFPLPLYNMYCIVATYEVNGINIILSLNLHQQELLRAIKIKL
jgi:hypothetical protein